MGKGQHEVPRHVHRFTGAVVAQVIRVKWGRQGVDVTRECVFPGCKATRTKWEKN
jgi:hypothetical protein